VFLFRLVQNQNFVLKGLDMIVMFELALPVMEPVSKGLPEFEYQIVHDFAGTTFL